jgi:hypothetical protein
MSKKTVIMSTLLVASIAMAIVPVSVRMRGLGPELVGIVDDEYSDLFFNPAFINKIEGNRVYTNLSNIHNWGDDLFFNGDYYPEMFYNLIGGVTSIGEHKVGGILEMGGADYLYTEKGNYTEIYNSIKEIDTMNYEYKTKNTDFALNLFWGKQLNNFHIGAWIGPHIINIEESEKYSESYYYYTNDTILQEYEFVQAEMSFNSKVNAYPVMVGMITGEPDNELSACLTYGYDRLNGITPVDYVSSEMYREIQQTLSSYSGEFEKNENTYKEGGFYLSLNGRNKRRYEDHSLSFLGSLVYVTQPITETYMDTAVDYSTWASYKEIEISRTTHKAKGPMNHFSMGIGVGAEKYFDALSTKNLFAIGLIPSFFTGSAKIIVEPEQSHYYYYTTYPDTSEYTVDYTSNETYEIKNTNSGFQITIPVGLETNLTDRLVLRLGATQNLMLKIKDAYENTLTDGGWTQHYVSGTYDTTYTEPTNELDSYYYKNEYKVCMANSITYHYGAGYKINDNIELDFLNFADLTNLRKWVLGVNIKF